MGQKVGICYKHDAMMFGSGIVEIERGKFAEPQPFTGKQIQRSLAIHGVIPQRWITKQRVRFYRI